MKFLHISKNKHMTPPEVGPSLTDATLAWARKYEGQIEQIWSFTRQEKRDFTEYQRLGLTLFL